MSDHTYLRIKQVKQYPPAVAVLWCYKGTDPTYISSQALAQISMDLGPSSQFSRNWYGMHRPSRLLRVNQAVGHFLPESETVVSVSKALFLPLTTARTWPS